MAFFGCYLNVGFVFLQANCLPGLPCPTSDFKNIVLIFCFFETDDILDGGQDGCGEELFMRRDRS